MSSLRRIGSFLKNRVKLSEQELSNFYDNAKQIAPDILNDEAKMKEFSSYIRNKFKTSSGTLKEGEKEFEKNDFFEKILSFGTDTGNVGDRIWKAGQAESARLGSTANPEKIGTMRSIFGSGFRKMLGQRGELRNILQSGAQRGTSETDKFLNLSPLGTTIRKAEANGTYSLSEASTRRENRLSRKAAREESERLAADERRWRAEIGRENVSDVVPSQRPVGQGTNAADKVVNEAESDVERASEKVPSAFEKFESEVKTGEASKGWFGGPKTAETKVARAKANYKSVMEGAKGMTGEKLEKYLAEQGERLGTKFEGSNWAEREKSYYDNLSRDPSFNDYMIGNQVYGKAAGVGVAALAASAVMGDGRRSNAQLYSSPF